VNPRRPVRDLLRAATGAGAFLPGVDPGSRPGIGHRDAAEADTPKLLARLEALQERLWVEHTRSLLIVLQAMDTGGKDGTIAHVVRAMNPAGVRVAAFKQPTEEERAHDFLWRIDRQRPAPGEVVIFNRSHYEDVLVVRVHALLPEEVWRARYEEINAWETGLVTGGTTIVKLFLHISYDEQRRRLLDRLKDPDKRWKFQEGDIDERSLWADYQGAYEDAIQRCSTETAPWYVVPADHKWYRNWAVASVLEEILVELDPRFPEPALDVQRLERRLAPPH
jgi:PPK2 family polyphosphate:nucleotide phosphotransferase